MRFLAVGLVLFAQVAFAQEMASSWDYNQEPSSSDAWVVFGGFSYSYAAQGVNYPGWDASVSEYPFPSHPWIGGTIETSGGYQKQGAASTGVYTVMGGPSIAPSSGGVRPFARAMVGGVMDRTTVPGSSSGSATVSNFGVDFGGGVDVYLWEHWGLREQGDWISYEKSGSRANMVMGVIGVVFRF